MQAFCTIISPDFLPFAESLHSSLKQFDSSIELHVLVASGNVESKSSGIYFYSVNDIEAPFKEAVVKKYESFNDQLRWSLKPVFMMHLLQTIDKLLYVDCDIFFFGNYDFLFRDLDKSSMLLTPHFAPLTPFEKEEKFSMNFLSGLYNAGFVGASKKGIKTLEWWASVCYYKTEDDKAKGFFVDQRYLDMIPVIDADAAIVRHQGCNVGSWNMETFKREIQPSNKVLINGRDEIIFIHFNHETLKHILNGDDAALKPYYELYEKTFAKTGFELRDFISKINEWELTGPIAIAKRRLSIRTRLKRLLFKLAKEL